MIRPFYWCRKCHRKVVTPVFLLTANVNGKVRLRCACGGTVAIEAKLKEAVGA